MNSSASNKKENIKDHIVSTATRIFSKFGFRKTTVDDIAQMLGKGKSSIYYYFKSKEDIFKEVIEREAGILRSEIYEKVLETEDNPKDKLRNYVLMRMKFLKELVNLNEALRNDYLRNLEFVERMRQQYDREEHEVLQEILREGIDKGTFRIDETEFAASAFVTVMKGLEVPLFIEHDFPVSDLEERLDKMLEILFYGLVHQNQ